MSQLIFLLIGKQQFILYIQTSEFATHLASAREVVILGK